jgi:hypothetical protein
LTRGNGNIAGVSGSSLIEDVESTDSGCGGGGGGDGEAGVTGNGDTSRTIGFFIGSEGAGRVGDGTGGFIC